MVRKGTYFRNAELLTLSAFETAMGSKGTGSEIEGLGAIAMERGAKAVIATLWSVSDDSTSLLMQEFYKQHQKNLPKVEALRQAQLTLLTGKTRLVEDDETNRSQRKENDKSKHFTLDHDKPYAHPYYWGPS